jgi:hypothetical protein
MFLFALVSRKSRYSGFFYFIILVGLYDGIKRVIFGILGVIRSIKIANMV